MVYQRQTASSLCSEILRRQVWLAMMAFIIFEKEACINNAWYTALSVFENPGVQCSLTVRTVQTPRLIIA